MIKAAFFDATETGLKYTVTEKDSCTTVTVSRDTDAKKIKHIDFEYIEDFASDGDEGYMIVPNEGMLCGFKNHSDAEYVSERYAMPVFGIKTEKFTCVAIVTGMAYNYSLVCGVKNGKYYIFPRFLINGDEMYEDISVSYYYLSGSDADYSGMARVYRNYQLSRDECKPLAERADRRRELAFARDSIMVRIRLGWKPVPVQILHQNAENEPEVITACDFDRVGDILDECKRQGVEKAEFCLVGWNTKGHDGRWPQCFPVAEELGGEEKLRALISKAQSMGYQITCHTNSTDTYEVSEMWNRDDLIENKDGSIPEDSPWSGGQMYWLCPNVALRQAKEILPQVAALGFRGIHYIDVLNIVMPRKCYNKKHPLNIKQSIEKSRELMKYAGEVFGGYSSEGGYDFGAKYQDFALNVRYFGESSPNPLCDETVPFWQLVYHGIIMSNPDMGKSLNFSVKNDKSAKLRLLEYGGRPTFYYYSEFRGDWQIKADADLVCGTDEQLKRSVSQLKAGCELNEILAPLQNCFMEKHEKLSGGVYRVTYSDGTKITVDYNTGDYSIEREEK